MKLQPCKPGEMIRQLKYVLAAMTALLFTACEIIGDIFQAGMYVGIFIVVALVALVFYLISRFRRRD